MQFQLNISFNAQGLQQIYSANQSVTLAKGVAESPAWPVDVAWLTF